MICYLCGKNIRGADKIKVRGNWIHKHHSPIKKKNVKVTEHGLKFKKTPSVTRAWGVNPEHYNNDQLLKRAVERSMGVTKDD